MAQVCEQNMMRTRVDIRANVAEAGSTQINNVNLTTGDTTMLDLLITSQVSDQIRHWIKAPDPFSNHNDACKRKHESTGHWLVDGLSFRNWLNEANSFLWLNGRPGCGKTILSSTAIEYTLQHYRSDRRVGIAYHYFTFTDNAKQGVSGMLRTMLLQLSTKLDDGNAALTDLYNTYKVGEPPEHALENTLSQILLKFEHVYLIIDALDETPRGERRVAVLRMLARMRSWAIRGLHVLITSRDEADIRDELGQIKEVSMHNKGVDKDVEDYIVHNLRVDPKFKRIAFYHAKIERSLIERAYGV
jgi:ankyrin repeat domain-containing protein 50